MDLKGRYEVVSNRESGLGRCDVMLFPLRKGERGIVIEFKAMRPRKEKRLEDTCASALSQIAEKRYADALAARGVARSAIYAYGFGFRSKEVLIAGGACQRRASNWKPAGGAGSSLPEQRLSPRAFQGQVWLSPLKQGGRNNFFWQAARMPGQKT